MPDQEHHDYVFRLHSTRSDSAQVKSWSEFPGIDEERLNSIEDVSDTHSNKVGSSIPTPLARIRLFDTAFEMVNRQGHNGDSMYHQLVSDCLDTMQLIFMQGINSENNREGIKVLRWDIEEELGALKNSSQEGHQLLGNALELFLGSNADNPPFSNLKEIYLLMYQGQLLGGTSPLTLFFTSPTWRQKGIKLPTSTEDILYDDIYAPLHKRDENFQEFLQKFRKAHKQELANNAPNLFTYLTDSLESNNISLYNKLEDELEDYTLEGLNQEYKPLMIDQNEILKIGNFQFYTVDDSQIYQKIATTSDLVIEPEVNIWQDKVKQGESGQAYKPLVLVSNIDLTFPATYFMDKKWENSIGFRKTDLTAEIPDRELPESGGINYPWISVSDFFEERIVRLPFQLNNEEFFTGSDEDLDVLLPISEKYFWFFTVEDLKQNLSIEHKDESTVRFNLKVPIKNGRVIEFKKTYDLNDEEICIENAFHVAISPLLRITDLADNYNTYNVCMVKDLDYEEEVKLNFLKQEDELKRIDSNSNTRHKDQTNTTKSVFYAIKGPFEVIQAKVELRPELVGLIIPRFKKVNNGNKSLVFGVDFGTSNTHVSWGATASPEDLTFSLEDNLVATLNKKGDLGTLPLFPSIMLREFLPMTIDNETGDDFFDEYPVSFPIRTTIFENKDFETRKDRENLSLFGEINIGFHFDHEEGNYEGGNYSTNLKWQFESGGYVEQDRVWAFFLELAHLIKIKAINEDGDLTKLQISRAYPNSMTRKARQDYEEVWNKAVSQVFIDGNPTESEPKRESIAPYFYLKNIGETVRQDRLVNIDIGGGTTDIMLMNPKTDMYFNTSFKFAADDLWGDPPDSGANKLNPYLELFRQNKWEEIMANRKSGVFENVYKDPRFGSEDVNSLLFSYDDTFRFSEYISREARDLLLGPIIHYSAIIYHFVQWLEKCEEEFPKFLSFTGKGSNYLNLIFKDHDSFSEFTKLLLKIYGVENYENISIIRNENPKTVTSKGLSAMEVANSNNQSLKNDHIRDLDFIGGNLDKEPDDYNDLTEGQEKAVLDNLQNFITETFLNKEVKNALDDIEIYNVDSLAEFFDDKNLHEWFANFKAYEMKMKENSSQKINETLFFYPLKYGIYDFLHHLKDQIIEGKIMK